MSIKNLFVLGWMIFILAAVNNVISQKEDIIASGRQVFMELAPVDPRSLIQGDYMRLRYAVGDRSLRRSFPDSGFMVIQLDSRGVGTYKRVYSESQPDLKNDEVILRYRKERRRVYFGTDSFFFQEGKADLFDNAKYGEFRVSEGGTTILVALRDENLKLLGEMKR